MSTQNFILFRTSFHSLPHFFAFIEMSLEICERLSWKSLTLSLLTLSLSASINKSHVGQQCQQRVIYFLRGVYLPLLNRAVLGGTLCDAFPVRALRNTLGIGRQLRADIQHALSPLLLFVMHSIQARESSSAKLGFPVFCRLSKHFKVLDQVVTKNICFCMMICLR